MNDSKIIAKQLLMDLGSNELRDKKLVAKDIRTMAEESESFENAVFEVGVMKIAKDCAKLCGKDGDTTDRTAVCLDEIGYDKEKIKSLKNWCVCDVSGGYLEEGEQYINMVFYNPAIQKYVELEFSSDGTVSITAPYDVKERRKRR